MPLVGIIVPITSLSIRRGVIMAASRGAVGVTPTDYLTAIGDLNLPPLDDTT